MGKSTGSGTVRPVPTIVLADNNVGDSERTPAFASPISELEGVNLLETIGTDDAPQQASRQTWGSKYSYLLALIGYSVGFGNIWRFPYQVRDNGGLVFLFPYFIMLAIMGAPTFFLELAVGQRRRKGIIYVWKEISPVFGGLGLCCGCLCFLIGLYYNTLIAYCIGYLIDSFRNPLPWSDCVTASGGNKEQQLECKAHYESKESKYYWYRGTLDASTGIDTPGNYSIDLALYHILAWVLIWLTMCSGHRAVEKITYFTTIFPYIVLLIFLGANCVIEPEKNWLGAKRLLKPDWNALWLPVTWLKAGSQVFFSLGLGVGCLVTFASFNPARNNCGRDAVIITLANCTTSILSALVVFPMIGGLGFRNYEACLTGMKQIFPTMTTVIDDHYDIYFTTKAKNWDEISLATPIHIRYGYGEMTEKAKENLRVLRFEEIIQNITDRGVVKPPTKPISFKSALRDCSIGKEATASGEGTGFVFVGFTEAVMHIRFSNFWSVLFFLMLILLGLDSGFGVVIGSVSTFQDLTNLNRFTSTTIVCGVMMCLALTTFPFGYGIYVLDLLDQFTVNWTLLTLASMECIAVSWGYGLARIAYDVKLMTGEKPNLYFLLCWKYITPASIIFLLITTIVEFSLDTDSDGGILYATFQPSSNSTDETGEVRKIRPAYTITIAFILMFLCIMWLPINAVLRKTKYGELIKDKDPGDFPEEELRSERNIRVVREADQFTPREKTIMGTRSLLNLQQHRDRTVKESTTSMGSGESLGSSGHRLDI